MLTPASGLHDGSHWLYIVATMNLSDIHRLDGPAGLRRLADATGTIEKYLYQCATGRKTPSPALAKALVAADPRLTLDDIYADVGAPVAATEREAA